MIVLASLIAIIIGLMVTIVVAKFLYKFSAKRGLLESRKDYIINAVILAFVFFCVSCIVYVVVYNI